MSVCPSVVCIFPPMEPVNAWTGDFWFKSLLQNCNTNNGFFGMVEQFPFFSLKQLNIVLSHFFLDFMILEPLPAHIKRFSVSQMQDYFKLLIQDITSWLKNRCYSNIFVLKQDFNFFFSVHNQVLVHENREHTK